MSFDPQEDGIPVPPRADARGRAHSRADNRAHWWRGAVGAVFTLNGTQFVVRKVTSKDLVLRPVEQT